MTHHAQCRIADALVLVFTRDVSLADWQMLGSLRREWALYERLAPYFGRLLVVSYGEGDDQLARSLGLDAAILCPGRDERREDFLRALPDRLLAHVGSDSSIIIKTNQFPGGDIACRLQDALRRDGRQCALMARAGYHHALTVAREDGAASPSAREAQREEERLCKQAEIVVATTPEIIETIAWRYGLSEDQTMVIPNYVLETPHDALMQERSQVVLCVGRLAPEKRVDLLLRAWAALSEDLRQTWKPEIIGGGPEEQRLRALADELQVATVFSGRLSHDELCRRLSGSAMLVQMSRYEGHPKTVIEAMACGAVPLVADVPGLRAVVRHQETGLVVDAASTSLAESIESLMRDPARRAMISAQAMTVAQDRYGLRRVVDLEVTAHQRALERICCGSGPDDLDPALLRSVCWPESLVDQGVVQQTAAWKASLEGFTRRLNPPARAKFLASLEDPLYQLTSEAAIAHEGGLHPKHRILQYHRFFVERITPADRVLDLGCGLGAVAIDVAANTGARIVGMDLSESNLVQAADAARARGLEDRLKFVNGDITTRRADGDFDVLILSNVLEHLQDRSELLRRWRHWYRPSRLLIRVPALDRDWRVPWKQQLGVEWRLDPTHELEYTRDALKGEIEDAGLFITELIAIWGEYWCVAREQN